MSFGPFVSTYEISSRAICGTKKKGAKFACLHIRTYILSKHARAAGSGMGLRVETFELLHLISTTLVRAWGPRDSTP